MVLGVHSWQAKILIFFFHGSETYIHQSQSIESKTNALFGIGTLFFVSRLYFVLYWKILVENQIIFIFENCIWVLANQIIHFVEKTQIHQRWFNVLDTWLAAFRNYTDLQYGESHSCSWLCLFSPLLLRASHPAWWMALPFAWLPSLVACCTEAMWNEYQLRLVRPT